MAERETERQIISSKEELRAGVNTIAKLATRSVTILTPDLEVGIYDNEEFLETIKQLVLQKSYARVRILISDPPHTVRNGNKFVELGRRLNSYISFRNLHERYRHAMKDAFIIADDCAVLYRKDANSCDGIMGNYEPAVAELHLKSFTEPWEASKFRHALYTDD